MTEKQIDVIFSKLDILINLVALSLSEDKKQIDQISILERANIQPKSIAEILGTTPNTVSVALSAIRKQKRKGK